MWLSQRHTPKFRKRVERLKSCDNVSALAEGVGVHGRLLYHERDRLEPIDGVSKLCQKFKELARKELSD